MNLPRRQFDPDTPEWMDVDQPESADLHDDLRNLALLNHLFGSYRLVLSHLHRWLQPGRPWRILDLATGSADIPRRIVTAARARGITVHVDAIDRQPSTLAIARRLCAGYSEITCHQADVLTFGQPTEWDIVLCSLTLHHFSEDIAIALLQRLPALARHHVLVADLRRSPLGTLGVDLLTEVWMRQPMTRNDARASVRRAFSFAEFAALARRAGWQNFTHRRHYAFRQALTLSHR